MAALAQGCSEQMIASGVYEHSSHAYRARSRFGAATAENIAQGYLHTGELHIGWMQSEGHRHNLLSPDLDAMGIGIVCRNDGVMWATQIFGRHEASPPRPAVDSGPLPLIRQDGGPGCPIRHAPLRRYP